MSQQLVIVAHHLLTKLRKYFYWKTQIKTAKHARFSRSFKSCCREYQNNQLCHDINNCFENNDISRPVLDANIKDLCIHCKKIYLYTKYIRKCTNKANGIMNHLKHLLKDGGINWDLLK